MSRTATPAPITDRRMWRKLLARLHPDAGGDHDLFVFGQAVRDRVEAGDLLAHDAVGTARRRSSAASRERPKTRGRSTAGGTSRITGEVAEPFGGLARRALDLAGEVEAPYGWLLGLLGGCEPPGRGFPAHLLEEARLGADYKRLARAGRAIGLDGKGRGRLYKLAARVPLTDYHARILLERLDQEGGEAAMNAYWLPSGNIMAPTVAVQAPDPGQDPLLAATGDGWVELARGTEEWHRWVLHVKGRPPDDVAEQVEGVEPIRPNPEPPVEPTNDHTRRRMPTVDELQQQAKRLEEQHRTAADQVVGYPVSQRLPRESAATP